MAKKTLRVSKIKDGTVIDHITRGHALDVIRILNIDGSSGGVVTIAMNVPSKKLEEKDVVKIEGRELNSDEVDKIVLLAPHATISIIRNYKVVEKQIVKLPPIIYGILKCTNPTCISNSNEPVVSVFYVKKEEDPLKLKCHYCNCLIEKNDILQQIHS